ncbi:catechol O-methyltransferase domain-containing protein 1 isoform X1 [Bufo bufo]|uniref:catechol O-methyltransferase domain-containing protein 1 isoform X1 n=2 Tax=Bufo bufo TaxID=8384 RepID=UPI001ABE7F8C|nr:catechol O-methyltransferase domain-containing protein 1 isoform X1 [Bufo bufo]
MCCVLRCSVLCTCSGYTTMSRSAVTREAVVGIGVLGVTFAAGVYIGKRYFMYRRKKSQKMFEGADDPRRKYLLRLSLREHPSAKKLCQYLLRTASQDVSSDAAQLLANLAKLINSKNILEMGCSYGYNPLVLALVLPSDGKLIAHVRETEDISHAREFWREAAVDNKIQVEVKSEEQTLDGLLSAGEVGTFDIIFINMSGLTNCRKCYEKCLRLLKSRGVLAIDGVLCNGAVLKKNSMTDKVQSIQQMNEAILRDARVFLSILPLADGLMLCFKL